MNKEEQQSYWGTAYDENDTGWDIGYPSPPIAEYIDQMTDKDIRILIPGAGNAYEAEYLHISGFKNVHVVDITPQPLANLKNRCADFPDEHLILGSYFDHEGEYDLQLEQTFFCAILPEQRDAYVETAKRLLIPGGRLVGVLFDREREGGPPYCEPAENFRPLFEPYFEFHTYETCWNSIPPREENEYFINLIRKD